MTSDTKPRPILVPVDFSPDSEAALLYAATLADVLDQPLLVLHVVHDLSEAPGYYTVKGRNKHLHRLEDVAADMLHDFMEKQKKKHPDLAALATAATTLVTGLPVTRILEVSDKVRARLIIMGSQGRTGITHMLLGSKAEQIVRLAQVPVTIVKPERKKKKKDS